jgi:hypothetical protein
MVIINKTGIANGNTIQSEHVTRIIDALSGISTDSIVATGSFSGSFTGDGSQLSGVSAGFPFTGSAKITGSLDVIGSFTVSPDYAASFRSPVVLLNNSSSYTEDVVDYDTGTIFIIDRTAGNSAGQFNLYEYDALQVGRSYKFIFPYAGDGAVNFKISGGTITGVYTDPNNIANNIPVDTEFAITDPSHCVVDATAVYTDGLTWFLQVVSNGLI